MTTLFKEATELVLDYFLDNHIQPKNQSEEDREAMVEELFNTNLRFCHHSLIDFLGNRFSDYVEYLEDYEEYINDYGTEKTADPVDVMNRVWYIYGNRIDYEEIQERIDDILQEDEEEEEEETTPLPVQQ